MDYKSLYPDLLSTVFRNNTDADIKDVIIAIVAWDENGLPVKIRGQFEYDDPTYVTKVTLEDINMIPGSTFGESDGYKLEEYPKFRRFKAMVTSYTTFEGEKWENPLFQDFCDLYEGKRLLINYNK